MTAGHDGGSDEDAATTGQPGQPGHPGAGESLPREEAAPAPAGDGSDAVDQQGPGGQEPPGPAGPAGESGDLDDVEDWLAAGAPIRSDSAEGAGDEPDAEDVAAGASDAERVVALEQELGERTLDLQRLQAEFLNYKRRVERDRDLLAQNAAYKALSPIVEVLDTIERAREHGEVEGGFKSVADQLDRTVAAAGLVRFGAVGDAFDPTVHEALSSMGPDPEGQASVTTVKVVAKAGYKIGDRVVRAAQVLTVEPAE